MKFTRSGLIDGLQTQFTHEGDVIFLFVETYLDHVSFLFVVVLVDSQTDSDK